MAVAKGLLLFLGVKGDLWDLLLYVKYLTIKHFNGLYDKKTKISQNWIVPGNSFNKVTKIQQCHSPEGSPHTQLEQLLYLVCLSGEGKQEREDSQPP